MSKYDGFSYGQLYAHYDSVLQVSQSVKPTSERGKQLQRDLGEIRMVLHAKAQVRIDAWNGTPSAKVTVCDHTQREPDSQSNAERASVGAKPRAKVGKHAAPAKTAASTSRTDAGQRSRRKKSKPPRKPSARAVSSSTRASVRKSTSRKNKSRSVEPARARSKRR